MLLFSSVTCHSRGMTLPVWVEIAVKHHRF